MGAPLFTKENARQFSDKGRDALRQKRLTVKQQAETLRQALLIVRQSAATLIFDYRTLRLSRIREALDNCDKQLAECILKGQSDEVVQWSTAMGKIAEQERLLAGRGAPKTEAAQGQPLSSQADGGGHLDLATVVEQPVEP